MIPSEHRVLQLIPPSDGLTTAAVCAQSRPLCTDSLLESLKPYAESRPDGVPASSAASSASQCPPFNPHTQSTMKIYVKAPVYRLCLWTAHCHPPTVNVSRPSPSSSRSVPVYTAGPTASLRSLPPALHSVPLHYLGRDHHVHSADVCTNLPHRNVNNSAQGGYDAVLFNNKGGFVFQLGGVKSTESISESRLKSEPQPLQRSPPTAPNTLLLPVCSHRFLRCSKRTFGSRCQRCLQSDSDPLP